MGLHDGIKIIPITKEYMDNWDKIFGSKKDVNNNENQEEENAQTTNNNED